MIDKIYSGQGVKSDMCGDKGTSSKKGLLTYENLDISSLYTSSCPCSLSS
jgi:hypothetical protein